MPARRSIARRAGFSIFSLMVSRLPSTSRFASSTRRSLLLWLTTGLISALLAVEILRQSPALTRRTWGHAMLVALLMSQMAWILSYWPFTSLLNALYLFWPFYLLTSVMHQYLGGQLNRAVALEFVMLGVAGWGVLWYYTP